MGRGVCTAQPRSSALRGGLIVVLCVVTCAVVVFTFKVILELPPDAVTQPAPSNVGTGVDASGTGATNPSGSTTTFTSPRNLLLMLMVLMLVCLGTLAHLLYRRTVRLVDAVARCAQEIADGNLAVDPPTGGPRILAPLSEAVKDIAVNYQEILLLTAAKVSSCRATLKEMEEIARHKDNPGPESKFSAKLKLMDRELTEISDTVAGFDFYHVRFDGTRILRGSESEKGEGNVG